MTAGGALVQTTTPEVTQTVIQRQIVDLPLNGRDPLDDQAAGWRAGYRRSNRDSREWRTPHLDAADSDGINIQDNFIRDNALNFSPNRPTSDTVS